MRIIMVFTIISFLLFASNQPNKDNHQLQERIKDLQNQLENTYKPGLGDFMSGIQIHHSKLWFAGINTNWKLADFEVHEIKEALNDIQKFNTERKETQSIPMLFGAIVSVNDAIQKKDLAQFKNSFVILTNICNSCHQATNHEFNVIKIPETPPFSNKDFKPKNEK
jgi:hypothetical protein